MKKLFLLLIPLIFCWSTVSAQITLEHTYPHYNVTIVHLGEGVYNYLALHQNSTFTLYNLNHSVNIHDTFPVPLSPHTAVSFFTSTLFDCDSTNVEYILRSSNCNPPSSLCDSSFVRIYRTDGTLLFHEDSVTTMFTFGGPTGASSPIMNTPNGTKLILNQMNNATLIYNLCDTLPTYFLQLDGSSGMDVSAYPNPAHDYAVVKYALPENVQFGNLVFYDTNGVEIKRFKIDHTFDHLQISTEDLRSGTYLYQLQTSEGTSGTKKLIKIE